MTLKVTKDDIAEMHTLIKSGDLSLSERREVFARIKGRAMAIDDEKLIIAIAATDDNDDELFAGNVIEVENGRYEIAENVSA